ncbi:M28 family metallopeptidase [Hyphomonadaceae bacterium BL14]|nr:M28 family metallopeptidase [Hyphomonadaceae bacterium BL14]
MRKVFICAAVLAVSACSVSQEPARPALEVTPGAIEAHIRFLADDHMEGREAGSRGYALATNYVEAQYRLIGLEPGGLEGYRAAVPLQTLTPLPEQAEMRIDGTAMVPGDDFIVGAHPAHGHSTVEAGAVFVGYGLVAPGLGLDAYDGLDLDGRIAVVLAGTPAGLPSDVAAHLNNPRTKAEFAAQAGAVGLIVIPAEGLTRWSFRRMAPMAGRPSMTTAAAAAPEQIRVIASVSDETAAQLFARAPQDFETMVAAARNGDALTGFDLGVSVALSQGTARETIHDDNVVGVLPGSDPALANEAVIVTAHLDHTGICRPMEDDSICNGALDNASGISVMLETARALASGPRPARPVVFIALAAEEKGLLGAAHIASNPTPAMGRMAANVNLDMPVILYEFNDMIAFGAEHSTLGPIAEAAASSRNVRLSPDPIPEQSLFVRSDHYHFVRAGVPSLFLMTGFSSPDEADDEGRGFLGFLSGNYHQPGDDLSQPLRFDQGAKFANINLAIIQAIANAPEAPRWNADSFFAGE